MSNIVLGTFALISFGSGLDLGSPPYNLVGGLVEPIPNLAQVAPFIQYHSLERPTGEKSSPTIQGGVIPCSRTLKGPFVFFFGKRPLEGFITL